MGILYDAAKRNMVLDRLKDLGISTNDNGQSVYTLDYDELKYLLVLAEFKNIDVNKDQNKWF